MAKNKQRLARTAQKIVHNKQNCTIEGFEVLNLWRFSGLNGDKNTQVPGQ